MEISVSTNDLTDSLLHLLVGVCVAVSIYMVRINAQLLLISRV